MKHSSRRWPLALAGLALITAGCSSEDDADNDAGKAPSSASPTADAEHPGDEVAVVEDDAAITADERLAPGVMAYDEFLLSTGGSVRIEVTPPTEGWTVHLGGPQRGVNTSDGENDWTGLLWYEVTGVYKRPCGDKPAGAAMVPMTDSLQPLLDMPYTTVAAKPTVKMLGGRQAQHAKLVMKDCDGDHPNPLVTGGDSGPLPIGDEFDIWLVPLPEAGASLVVFDATDPGSEKYRQEWQQVVDSLHITVERS